MHEAVPEDAPVPGHQPGEGCDFCDALRVEQADEAELDAAIAEEEGGEAPAVDEEALDDGPPYETSAYDDDGNESETTRFSSSETIRGFEEEGLIKDYLRSIITTRTAAVHHPGQTHPSSSSSSSSRFISEEEEEDDERREMSTKQSTLSHVASSMVDKKAEAARNQRAKRASDWGRSYQLLVGRRPSMQTLLQFERYPEPAVAGRG